MATKTESSTNPDTRTNTTNQTSADPASDSPVSTPVVQDPPCHTCPTGNPVTP